MILNIHNNMLLKKHKKIYNFSVLICLKSHIKFKDDSNTFLIKINNNISLFLMKKTTIHVKVQENKIFFFCKNLKELNEFTKKLLPYSSNLYFL